MSESFAELFEQTFASQQIKPGAIIMGTIVAINDDVVIVTAGLKSEAVIPSEQFRNDKAKPKLLSATRLKLHSMPSKTDLARRNCHAKKQFVHAPGSILRKPTKTVKLSSALSMVG